MDKTLAKMIDSVRAFGIRVDVLDEIKDDTGATLFGRAWLDTAEIELVKNIVNDRDTSLFVLIHELSHIASSSMFLGWWEKYGTIEEDVCDGVALLIAEEYGCDVDKANDLVYNLNMDDAYTLMLIDVTHTLVKTWIRG